MAEIQRGVVKWFNDAKGFGFIEHESGRDVFVHYSVIEIEGFKTLKDGEEVDYELREGDKGLNASRVIRANSENEGLAAPKLESGSVNTVTKTAAEMIEVEKQPESTEDSSLLMPNQSEAEDDSSLIEH
jgi:CspA family cold shock protein